MIQGVTEKQLLARAIQNYDVAGKPIDLDEFKKDFSKIQFLCKFIKQYKTKDKLDQLNIRLLLNYFIIIYNTFEGFATEALFYYADEVIYPEVIAFLHPINRYPPNGEVVVCELVKLQLDDYTTNAELLAKIQQELQ